MIEILINGTSLDLEPNSTTEFQQNSSFFDPTQIQGEYSLPIELPCTGKNLRLLGYVNELSAGRDKVKINTVTWSENGLPLYVGTLVTESVTGRISSASGKISAYFVCGVSNFWQKIKDKKMTDLRMGGDLILNSYYELYGNVLASLNSDSDHMNFVFAPIINENFGGEGGTYTWMNKPKLVKDDATHYHLEVDPNDNFSSLVPMAYLVYVLRQLFAENGYTLSGDILNDPDFKKIIIPNFNALFIGVISIYYPVTLNLSNHMPDVSVGDFIIAIQNKFGIGFQFDNNKNSCTLISLTDVKDKSRRKDFSKKVNPSFKINFTEPKSYSFTQEFDSADSSIQSPDFSTVNIKGTVLFKTDLPPISSVKDNDCFLCLSENQYFYRAYNPTTTNYEWTFFADNIYDLNVSNSTDNITSKATCLGMRYYNWAKIGVQNIGSWFPNCLQQGNSVGLSSVLGHNPFGLRLMFYHGLKNYLPGLNTISVPFTSNSNYFMGTKIGNWSLSYVAGTSGLVNQFWNKWLKILGSNEEVDFTLYPSLADMLQMQWSDIFLINNVPYLLSQRTPVSPFNKIVPVKAVRIPL